MFSPSGGERGEVKEGGERERREEGGERREREQPIDGQEREHRKGGCHMSWLSISIGWVKLSFVNVMID